MIFSKDSVFLYCANASPGFRDEYRDLTVTCIRFKLNTRDVKDIKLTDGKSQQGLTIESAQKLHPPQHRSVPSDRKNVPFTLAVSPDNRELFVSAGKMIMKIDTDTFTLHPWRTEVELPCRLISVGKGHGNTWTLYAMGHYYEGDGNSVHKYKTHLYAIPVPKG